MEMVNISIERDFVQKN